MTHCEHVDAPLAVSVLVVDPGLHTMHDSAVELEYVPAAQKEQSVAPADENRPEAHGEQLLTPPPE